MADLSDNIDKKAFKAFAKDAQKEYFGQLNSLLIAHRQKLIYECYVHEDLTADQLVTLQSATKSITAILIGIAIDKGLIPTVESSLELYFPYLLETMPDKKQITIRDLLCMASCIAWNEAHTDPNSPENDLRAMSINGNYLGYYLSKPMVDEAGTKFNYSGASTIALGEIIRKAAGMSVEKFANTHLFEPLGIEESYWEGTNPQGQYFTSGGLYLRPRDFLKIGMLVSAGGSWGGKQVVSASWFEQMTSKQISTGFKDQNGTEYYYGYQWWIDELNNGMKVAAAKGFGQQTIYLIKDLDLVVVTTGSNFKMERPRKSEEAFLISIIDAFGIKDR